MGARGRFITLEGIDASGKSTQARLLTEWLSSNGIDVIETREPGGTIVAEKIRHILLDCNNIEIRARTELLLYLASRAQHTEEIIIPALDTGKWVISDRFADSSVAYQGFARALGMETVREMCIFATAGIIPEITFFIDISPVEASRRMREQGKTLDKLENEDTDFVRKVREGYLCIADFEPERFIVIDGERPRQEIANEIGKIILQRFPELHRNKSV